MSVLDVCHLLCDALTAATTASATAATCTSHLHGAPHSRARKLEGKCEEAGNHVHIGIREAGGDLGVTQVGA
jgi:hypothetical protein